MDESVKQVALIRLWGRIGVEVMLFLPLQNVSPFSASIDYRS